MRAVPLVFTTALFGAVAAALASGRADAALAFGLAALLALSVLVRVTLHARR